MHYFLVYNDNTHTKNINQLIKSMEKYGPEFKIIIFHKEQIDTEFYNQHRNIMEEKRGGGYWLWKPYIINRILNEIEEGDILLYLDSSYYFKEDFTELYREQLEKKDILIFKNKPNESTNYMKYLCKMDVVVKYDMYDTIFHQNVDEFWAGCMFLKKTPHIKNIIQEWLNMCCIYEDITDSPSKIPNDNCFWDHRHDQALLSIVLHKKNIQPVFFEKKYLQNVRCPYIHDK